MKKILSILLFFPFFSNAQVIITVAGTSTGGYDFDGVPATSAKLSSPYNIGLDGSGNLYIRDAYNKRVRKVSPAFGGTITTIAGTGVDGYFGDGGPATNADIRQSFNMVVDYYGNVYLSEGSRIRKVGTNDTIRTIAGTGVSGYSGDGGPATLAKLNCTWGIAADDTGNVYFVDGCNNVIRRINSTGIITTYAGTGLVGYCPDGSLADTAKLTIGNALALDKDNNIYYVDSNRIRKIDKTTKIITTIAGTGILGFSGDGGPAIAADITPSAMSFDIFGILYFTNSASVGRVRRISAEGTISTIAGGGGNTAEGINPLLAVLSGPQGIAVSSAGDIYVSSTGYHKVRVITSHLSVTNNLPKNNVVNVYPNPCPAGEVINIVADNGNDADISVINVIGTLLFQAHIDCTHPATIKADWPPGTYIVKISTQEKFSTLTLQIR